jgi:hypothetical protein
VADCLIVVNAGSSSMKFALHSAAPPFEARLRGLIEGIGTAPHLRLRDAAGATKLSRAPGPAARGPATRSSARSGGSSSCAGSTDCWPRSATCAGKAARPRPSPSG